MMKKKISISHNITGKVDYSKGTGTVNMDFSITCSSQDTQSITISDATLAGKVKESTSGKSMAISGSKGGTTMEWDPAIWEIWNKEKKVTITMP